MAKNRFPGSVLVLALALASSACGGSGSSDSAPPPAAIPAAWRTAYRTPTGMNLRGARFGRTAFGNIEGVVVGEAGTIFRYIDRDTTGTAPDAVWFQHEPQPVTRQGDFVALDNLNGSFQAAGNDATGGKYWNAPMAFDWYTADSAGTPGNFTDVDVIQSNSDGTSAVSIYLRTNGDLVSVGSAIAILNSGVGTAQSLDFVGLSGEGYVCGSNGGNAAVGKCVSFGTNAPDWTSMVFDTSTPAGTLQAIQITEGLVSLLNPTPMQPPIPTVVRTGCTVGDNGIIRVLQEYSTGPSTTEFRWKEITSGTANRLRGVHFPLDHSVGWVVGDSGTVLKLTWIDPGVLALADFSYTVTPQTLTPPTTRNLHDVWFVDGQKGFIVGDGGVVYRTTNAGSTWTLISGGSADHFNAADFAADGLTGIAVGDGGVAARTLDGGYTWTTSNTGLSGDLLSISIPKTSPSPMAFACGTAGVFRCSNLSAPTLVWSAMTGPAATTYRGVHFGGTAFGVVVGDDSAGAGTAARVYTTSSGDAPSPGSVFWTAALGLPTDTSFLCATAAGNGATYYIGGAGGVRYSAAPGTFPNWSAVGGAGTPPTGDIVSIQAPGGVLQLVTVETGGAVRRLSAGTWDTAGAVTGTPISTAFMGASDGFLATTGAGGGIFRTKDAGTSWAKQAIHTTNTLRFVGSSPAFLNGAWACGMNGTILITNSGGE